MGSPEEEHSNKEKTMIGKLFSATVKIAALPVAAAVDIVTMGGVLTDWDDKSEPKSATVETLKSIGDDVRKIRR